ncbi:putative camp-regulated phosphoprotein [Schistosoma mansoni]|uniref:putative camp-regulated phosphoprotein n=1 Tax=Schistosoma mansoni TaxID=6183 RepID=UPI0001A6213C|nr:putative camp-regulated phosphoprotein [Schistosoma mansoni]|eukprot:XP_018652552.1 putative camp-regulated phosphoprotein [Schistosoma mansoni]
MESTSPTVNNMTSSVEEELESKIKSKYPGLNKQGVGSLLLQKRLNRGHKYFDSGDYNMARAKILQQQKHVLPPQTEEAILHESTGETMATPDSVPAVRKKSILSPNGVESVVNPVAVSAPSKASLSHPADSLSLLST